MTPIHRWTNGGSEVLILRCCDADGKSHGGFQWPLEVGASVEAPDWDPEPECGHGLHGWPWGLSMGDSKNPDWSGKWIVFSAAPDEVVDLGGKVKARRGTIRFVGDWQQAANFVLAGQIAWVEHAASGAASATGTSGAASATGWRGAASATGWRGAASATGERGAASATGERGAASATGERGAASATGERGAASATGWSGAASATGESGAASATGESGAACVTGLDGKAMAGPYGCIALAWHNARKERIEMRCATVGQGDGKDKKLKAGVWYRLNSQGRFVEVK